MWDLEISDLITPLLRFFPLCLRVSVVKILVCRAADRSACGGKKRLEYVDTKKTRGEKANKCAVFRDKSESIWCQ